MEFNFVSKLAKINNSLHRTVYSELFTASWREMRVFIAIDLPDSIQDKISKISEQFSDKNLPLRFVAKYNIHLTLAFFGEVESDKISEIVRILDTFRNFSTFSIKLDRAGVFPDQKRPRILWIGAESKDLAKLQNKLSHLLSQNQIFFDQKPFHPHFTVGRISGRISKLSDLISQFSTLSDRFIVKSIGIYSSQTLPSGPKYQKLHEFKLKE